MTEATLPRNNRLLVIDDNQAIHADFKKILQPPEPVSAGLGAARAAIFKTIPRQAAARRLALSSGLEQCVT